MKYRKTVRAAVALLALGSARAHAATFTVTNLDDNGAGSLRNAILLADIVSGADIVVFQAGLAGTIQLSADEGQIPILEDLEIVGPGPAALAVSGGNATRVFSISAGSTVTITGLTITEGKVRTFDEPGAGIFNGGNLAMSSCILSENHAEDSGGGIFSSGSLTLTDCTFLDNSSSDLFGGGIHNDSGTATLTHCTFSLNSGFGGGISNFEVGTVTMTDCIFSHNAGEGGGAINNDGTMTLTRCTITDQVAFIAGAISNVGTLSLTDCRIAGNRAQRRAGGILTIGTATLTRCTVFANGTTEETGTGGGIYNSLTMTAVDCTFAGNGSVNGGGIYNSGNLTLTNSTVNGNVANEGGGILNEVDRVFVRVALPTVTAGNTTVSGNRAFTGGGFLSRSLVQLINCTLSGNRSDSGAGIHNASTGTVTLGNTLVANSGSGLNCFSEGVVTSLGHNLDSDGTFGLLQPGDQSGTLATPLDPLLGPLQNNGGRTETHALSPGSPAIDAGDATLSLAGTDQRGFPRISDGDQDGTPLIDIGAFELSFLSPFPFQDLNRQLLTYTTISESNTPLPAGSETFNLTIHYSPDVTPGTFVAKLNGQYLTGLFSPTPGGFQTVPIPLSPGQNFLSLRVKGKSNGRPAEDVDTLGFRVGDPPFGE
jgi:predicted outer membrane repeat protein